MHVIGAAQSPLKLSPDRTKLLYSRDKIVIIRDVEAAGDKPIQVQLYSEHGYKVTGVEMATSGCYVASGDASGVVRIWACDNPEQILKLETPVLGGPILDIAWSADSQRVVAAGEGKDSMAKVFMWDSGNTVGDISGNAKRVNAVSFKSSRPFRIATAGEDGQVNFYQGPPFKFDKTTKKHTQFVNCVRFSPDGSRFFSASSDKEVAIFDGKDGSLVIEKVVAKGSVYAAAWSPDNAQILTASGDKTAKILDAGTLEVVKEFAIGTTTSDMVTGCAWSAAGPVVYTLGGAMMLLEKELTTCAAAAQFGAQCDAQFGAQFSDVASIPSPRFGHNQNINCISYDSAKGVLYSASHDSIEETSVVGGTVREWDLKTGYAKALEGGGAKKPQTSACIAVGLCGGMVVTAALDDSVGYCGADGSWGKVAIEACPKGMAASESRVAVVTTQGDLALFAPSGTSLALEKKAKAAGGDPTCVAISPNGGMVAVGGGDMAVYVYDAPGCGEKYKLTQHKGAISAVAISADGSKLASGCSNKEVVVWDLVGGTKLHAPGTGFHPGRISCLAWGPGGDGLLASGAISGNIIVWDFSNSAPKKEDIKLAHIGGGVNSLAWVAADELASCGADAMVKTWKV